MKTPAAANDFPVKYRVNHSVLVNHLFWCYNTECCCCQVKKAHFSRAEVDNVCPPSNCGFCFRRGIYSFYIYILRSTCVSTVFTFETGGSLSAFAQHFLRQYGFVAVAFTAATAYTHEPIGMHIWRSNRQIVCIRRPQRGVYLKVISPVQLQLHQISRR